MSKGYYQQPTIYKDKVVFTCEEDLWQVALSGGVARRLTSGRGGFHNAVFSPDGSQLAITASEFGVKDIYVMNADGGELERKTWYNTNTTVRKWTKKEILFSGYQANGLYFEELATLNTDNNEIKNCNLGPAIRMAESAYWKRYRGGTAGKFYLKKKGQVNYSPFLRNLNGNLTHPMWIGSRFYFLSDHEGSANIYSTDNSGKNIKKHTYYKQYYVRNPYTDGVNIVFHMAGDIYVFSPAQDKCELVNIDIHSQKSRSQSKFISVTDNLESLSLSPKAQKISLTSRGQIFYGQPWLGPVISPSRLLKQRHRDRLGEWLNEDEMVFVCDEFGDEKLCIVNINTPDSRRYLKDADVGQVITMKPSPDGLHLAIVNQRNELLLVNLKTGKTSLIFHNEFDTLGTFSWSPDSKWIVSVQSLRIGQKQIVLWNFETKLVKPISKPALDYRSVEFSEKGDLVYYLGVYNFDPRYERTRFSLYFEGHYQPVAILLNKNIKSPFGISEPLPVEESKKNSEVKNVKAVNSETAEKEARAVKSGKSEKTEKSEKEPIKNKTVVDFDGIENRLIPIPCKDYEYSQIFSTKDGVLLLSYINESAKGFSLSSTDKTGYKVDKIDFVDKKQKTIYEGTENFIISANREFALISKKKIIRLKKINELNKEDSSEIGCNPKSGQIDLARFTVPVYPFNEWQQIFDESWRLQKLFFGKKISGALIGIKKEINTRNYSLA